VIVVNEWNEGFGEMFFGREFDGGFDE